MHRLTRPLPFLCCAISVLSLSGCGGGSASTLGLTDSATALTRAEKPSPSPSASPSPNPSPKPLPSPSPTTQPIQGTVSALVAGKSFTLTPPPPPGQTTAPPPLTIDLSATTKILGPDGKAATLANGQDVCVQGKVNDTTKTVAADEVQVIPPPPIQGAVSALKAGVSFTLTPPAGDDDDAPAALTVLLSASTKITGPDGKTATLANNEAVTVTGALDKAKKTVTADAIAILPPPPPVQGVIKAVNAKTLSFTLTPPPPPPGASDAPPTLTVDTDAKTKIVKKGVNGSPDTAATFADLKAAECVAVEGSIAKGATTDDASEVDILPPPPPAK